MQNIMILAETIPIGERYARNHGHPTHHVITPRSTHRARGHEFDDYITVGDVRLDEAQWADLTPALLNAGQEVIERFYHEAQGELPAPIALERETVPKFH